MKPLICLLIAITFAACHTTKNPGEKNTPVEATSATDALYRFSVSFISIGAGPDRKSRQRYDQFISDYQQLHNTTVEYIISPWGKEGEVDYCFLLSELDSSEQQQFIKESKEFLENSSLVRYRENTACQQKQN